jgi:5S rRNA maturation endonuclease (ribonuclease M5)
MQVETSPDRKIDTTSDHQGSTIQIWMAESLNGSACVSLFLKTYAELVDRKLSSAVMSWNDFHKYHAVYCTNLEGQVLGGIAFEYRPIVKEGWIILSFTAPESRGRRINQILHRYFEKVVISRGGDQIGSHVHVDNQSRLKACERVGLKPQFYKMKKYLKNQPGS